MAGFVDSLGNLGVAPSVERLVRQGQAFGGTGGKLTLAAAGNAGVALWNPAASGRQVFVYGVQWGAASAVAFGVVAKLTADPGWTAAVIHNEHRSSTTTAGAAPAAANVTDVVSLAVGELLQWAPEMAETLLPPGKGIVL